MPQNQSEEIEAVGRRILNLGIVPTYLDIGAAGGLRPEWQDAADRGFVDPLLADFDRSAEDHLPYIFGDENRVRDFHVTAMPGCSSCLEPLRSDWLRNCPLGYYFEVVQVIRVEEVRADSLINAGKMPAPELLKLDVQGYEFQCLGGFGEYLERVVGIQIESHFKALYEDQVLFPEMCAYLDAKGFILRHMQPDNDWGDGEIIEIDAYFSKPRSSFAPTDPEALHLGLWETVLKIPQPTPHIKKDLAVDMRRGIVEGFIPQALGTDD